MDVPTKEDWPSEPCDLDEACAYKHFHGKTLVEAVRLFAENASMFSEDLMYMPCRVFGYYVEAYMTYLTSDAARGDSEAASCFIGLIDHKTKYGRNYIIPLWHRIEPVLKKLAEQQENYDEEWVIYGSFRARINEIVRRGFDASFDAATPETVPKSVTVQQMVGSHRTVPWPVAVQIFRNSGVGQLDASSRKRDVLQVFGVPDATGGGVHPKYGHIPDWIRYDHPHRLLRFQFDGDFISGVAFMHPTDLPR